MIIPIRRRCNSIFVCFHTTICRCSRHGFARAAHTGAYRFRRGCGGRISGQRRLASIKRATYKLKNNNEVAVAA
nr:MAG TPA: hypothetical protein [Caudoviricetes sp.]